MTLNDLKQMFKVTSQTFLYEFRLVENVVDARKLNFMHTVCQKIPPEFF